MHSAAPRQREPASVTRVSILLSLLFVAPLAAEEPPSTTDAAHPEVQILDWAETQELIAGHRGKLVLVDIWTTTCPPCIEKFPEFVALHEQYGPDRLVCISVNCDYDGVPEKPPEHYLPKVGRFLADQQADFEHVLLNVPFVDFLEQIELGTTPAYLLYGADGQLIRRFDNDEALEESQEFTMAQVADAVKEQLP